MRPETAVVAAPTLRGCGPGRPTPTSPAPRSPPSCRPRRPRRRSPRQRRRPTSSIASAPGFTLEDLERAAIETQLAWYAQQSRVPRARVRPRRALHAPHRPGDRAPRHAARARAAAGGRERVRAVRAIPGRTRHRASGSSCPAPASASACKQDWWYDGRRDVLDSTRAALDYLQFLHDEFNGDWLLAIAALQLRRVPRRARGARESRGRQAGRISSACACRPRPAPTCRSCWRCAAWSRTPRTTASRSARSRTSRTSSRSTPAASST